MKPLVALLILTAMPSGFTPACIGRPAPSTLFQYRTAAELLTPEPDIRAGLVLAQVSGGILGGAAVLGAEALLTNVVGDHLNLPVEFVPAAGIAGALGWTVFPFGVGAGVSLAGGLRGDTDYAMMYSYGGFLGGILASVGSSIVINLVADPEPGSPASVFRSATGLALLAGCTVAGAVVGFNHWQPSLSGSARPPRRYCPA